MTSFLAHAKIALDIVNSNSNSIFSIFFTCIVMKHNIYPMLSCLQEHDTRNDLATHEYPNAGLSIFSIHKMADQ